MASERSALLVSIAISVALAAIGVAWGIVSGSQIILLDGLFSVVGIATSWMLLRASKLSVSGPSASYPFGREAMTPLVIGVQGLVLGATLIYAAGAALTAILRGGSDVAPLPAIAYGILVSLACGAVWVWLRSPAAESEIVRAEAAAWRVAFLRGVGIIIGFVILLAIRGSELQRLAPYVDPIMVLVACLALIGTPIALVRSTLLELLESVPPEEIRRPVADALDAVADAHAVADPTLRITKLGPKLYVEVEALADGNLTIADEHAVRGDLRRRLDALPYGIWLNFELHPRTQSPADAR